MDEVLLPCPFCGKEAYIWSIGTYKHKVSCKGGCVTMPDRNDIWFTSEDEAIKAWNRRVK